MIFYVKPQMKAAACSYQGPSLLRASIHLLFLRLRQWPLAKSAWTFHSSTSTKICSTTFKQKQKTIYDRLRIYDYDLSMTIYDYLWLSMTISFTCFSAMAVCFLHPRPAESQAEQLKPPLPGPRQGPIWMREQHGKTDLKTGQSHEHILVGGFSPYPSEKWWVVSNSWDDFSQYMEKEKMFQSTNQHFIIKASMSTSNVFECPKSVHSLSTG